MLLGLTEPCTVAAHPADVDECQVLEGEGLLVSLGLGLGLGLGSGSGLGLGAGLGLGLGLEWPARLPWVRAAWADGAPGYG